jgi:hypothetical protein
MDLGTHPAVALKKLDLTFTIGVTPQEWGITQHIWCHLHHE